MPSCHVYLMPSCLPDAVIHASQAVSKLCSETKRNQPPESSFPRNRPCQDSARTRNGTNPPKRHSRESGNTWVGRGQTAIFPTPPPLDSRFRGNDVSRGRCLSSRCLSIMVFCFDTACFRGNDDSGGWCHSLFVWGFDRASFAGMTIASLGSRYPENELPGQFSCSATQWSMKSRTRMGSSESREAHAPRIASHWVFGRRAARWCSNFSSRSGTPSSLRRRWPIG